LLVPTFAIIVLTLAFWIAYWFIRFGGIHHYRVKHQAEAAARKKAAHAAKLREDKRLAPLRAIDDPRDAATILMLLAARDPQNPSSEQLEAIEHTLRTTFGFDHELTERMVQARFIARHAESFEEAADVFSALLLDRLTSGERLELVEMVRKVVRLDEPTPSEPRPLVVLKRQMGLSAATV
jgi:uncharacterized tellurite resistance protein B-like protein